MEERRRRWRRHLLAGEREERPLWASSQKRLQLLLITLLVIMGVLMVGAAWGVISRSGRGFNALPQWIQVVVYVLVSIWIVQAIALLVTETVRVLARELNLRPSLRIDELLFVIAAGTVVNGLLMALAGKATGAVRFVVIVLTYIVLWGASGWGRFAARDLGVEDTGSRWTLIFVGWLRAAGIFAIACLVGVGLASLFMEPSGVLAAFTFVGPPLGGIALLTVPAVIVDRARARRVRERRALQRAESPPPSSETS